MSAPRRLGEVAGGTGGETLSSQACGQRFGGVAPAAPDHDLADRADRGVRPHEVRRQCSGADHDQPPGIRPCEARGGEGGRRGGAADRQHAAVEHGARRPGGAVEQQ
jgi:hypothetical protein